jgi:hypothetical protein
MPTVIDALLVTLNLDPAGFTRGQKQAAQSFLQTKRQASEAAKDIEGSGKRAAEFFSRLRKEAIGWYAAITGVRSLRHFGQDAASADAAVGRMSRTLGIATDRLSAYQNMAERVGASREGITASFQSLQDQVEAFRLLGQPLSGAFRALGIEVADPATGAARSTEDIYRASIEALRQRAPSERPTLARELGLGQDAVGLSNLPKAEFDRLFEEQRRLGTVNERQAAAGQRLLEAWLNLSQAFESGWRSLREQLTPAVEALLQALTNFVLWLNGPDLKPAIDKLAESIRWLADYLGSAQFRNDMEAFGRGLRDMGLALVRTLRYFGLIAPEAVDGVDGPAAPGAPGAGAVDRLQSRIEQDRTQSQRGWGDFFRERLPTWLGGYGEGRGPGDVGARQREAQAFFTSNGYSAEQAAGIVANLHHESGLDPQVRAGDGGRSHGIAQWNGDRLANFMARNGGRMPEQTTLQEQLAFALWELSEQGPEAAAGRAIRGARTAREAGAIGSRRWLRPRDTEAEARARGDTANNFVAPLTTPAQPTATAAQPPPGPQSYLDPGLLTGSRAAVASVNNRTSTSSSEVSVGQVNVQTAATDAPGIARSIGDALKQYAFVNEASRGLA